MDKVIMDESKVFDACALLEELLQIDVHEGIRTTVQSAVDLLNQALEEGEPV